ncbi:MAG: hypothetical protein IKC83_00210, partial [Clostridia bacterium]|nr:hypothetical protein [Clostridia bacterium]
VGEYDFIVTVKVDMIDATVLILDSKGIKSEEYKTALYLNQTYTFTPSLIKGGEMIDLDGITIEYHSSNKSVATATADGKNAKISAIALGKTNVWATCEYDGESYTSRKIEVTVKNSTEILLSKESFTFVTSEDLQGNPVSVGATDRIYVSYRNLATGEIIPVSQNDIVFEVENKEIATVDSWGNLMGKSAGTTKLKISTEFGEASVDIAVSFPIYSAQDLDTIALATYNMTLTQATKFLAGNFVLMNDIDYATHTRNYMLPIASLNANDAANVADDLYLDRDTPRYGEEHGGVSYYSKAWKEILSLTEGYEAFTVTDSAQHEDASEQNPVNIQAKRLFKANGEPFEGINPNGVKFTGTLDGNGYSIKNAWLMLDNYLMSGGFVWTVSVSPAYMSGFIGYQAGTVKNISFDNLSIGDVQTIVNNGKYDYASRKGNWGSYVGSIGALYTGMLNADNNQSEGYGVNSRSADRFYIERVTIDGKEKADSFRRGIPFFGYWNNRESTANALFIKNEGTIENIKMSYIATGTISDGNNVAMANGFVLVNDGKVNNSVVERKVYEGQYITKPQKGRLIFLNRPNGSVENVYLTTNGIGNDMPYNSKGLYDVTECNTSNLLAGTVSGLDASIWSGASLIKGCALKVD